MSLTTSAHSLRSFALTARFARSTGLSALRAIEHYRGRVLNHGRACQRCDMLLFTVMPTLMLIHQLHIITTKVITGFPDTLCRSLCILCLRALLARACPSSSYKVQQFHHTHAIILRTSYVRDTSDPLKLVRLPSFHTMSKSFDRA